MNISLLGTGSWGTALAIQLARREHQVTLWGHRTDAVTAIDEQRENVRYLPGVKLSNNIRLESSLTTTVKGCDALLIATPSHAFREILQQIKTDIDSSTTLIWASKGVEPTSHKLLHQAVEEELGKDHPKAIISGPTFAREVAEGLPTAVTIAADSIDIAHSVAEIFHSKNFRCYTSTDIIGVEIGGATKNVLAIAAGIADGLGFGANTRAALITRGLHELIRLGVALGGKQETFMGMGGLGDLILTCTDNQSRNRRLGLAIGGGENIERAISSINQVVEGAQAARDIVELAKANSIEIPISEQVSLVIHNNKEPQRAVQDLLQRGIKHEMEF
ncbi:MAG: NAD(P)-dependent glycerol-3-phosphate dehydrogenase [Thiotrichales bacterium]|nr:NAD(P)-dependent glycerol-3-phosphate dehydrogenase [Thiotrichales bacterium]MBT7006538.1 NAD(P)-dependent glycerol-3-phosphate dehydrogenase [Thiotrichales bacterium]MBT7870875.1 NAD(P)-dependent glycerol-3-phosphate dehydrogenase [Thiotrichales bacterium]